MENTILQWNCRGLKPNYDEILLLLNTHNPAVLSLQETFLKTSDNISLKNYSIYNYIFENADKASGGASVVVNNNVLHSQIQLDTELQAVAVSVTLHRVITICSIYIPPRSAVNIKALEHLVSQLPSPFILLGDFNAHNPMWGSTDTNAMGQVVEDFVEGLDLCLFNNKSHTYLHPATGSFSCIDLSICHPTVLLDYDWKVGDDLCGSDHFPIIMKNIGSPLKESTPRWKLNKANWEKFELLCDTRITSNITHNNDPILEFTSILYSIAEECIPKSSCNPKHQPKPWYNDECKEAIKKRKSALRRFKNHPNSENLENVRIFRAKARRSIKSAKKTSWRKYVSKLNSRTSVKKVWDMVRKVSGKGKPAFGHLNVGNTKISSQKHVVNVLADSFANHSSSTNCSRDFKHIKKEQEKRPPDFKSNNHESYNANFTLSELQESLSKAHDTAAGPDEIHYQFLKHLPSSCLNILLDIFNSIWTSGTVPASWKEATVIPIPKPGKDNTDPNNYRPIALTSCVCKTLERMINKRLVWYLESNNILTEFQSGFRSQRSTNDHLIRLENFIRDGFVNNEHIVGVFFDLEKAYDTTWKHGILQDLQDAGLKGRLPLFITDFLNNREFKVRVGSTLSDMRKQEMGVPQGSILSVTLFNVKINNIVKCITEGTDCSLFVDDFCICYRSKSMSTVERKLQQSINKVHRWATENGFKFSKSKTNCVHFCQKRGDHLDPQLHLDGSPIPVVAEVKFLGVIFDKKLSFLPHIKYIKGKCQRTLNLLRVLAHTDWGADRKVLLRLYRALVRSKLDYGCVVYGSARKSYLRMLDPIHHHGLRLALGAFRTSPAKSLYVEANEPSLHARRNKLSMQYTSKLSSNPSNPAHNVVFKPKYQVRFASRPNVIPTFGIRMKHAFEDTDIDLSITKEVKPSPVPPWTIQNPTVILDLSKNKKSETSNLEFQSLANEKISNFDTYKHVFTDGSKENEKVAAACVTDDTTVQFRLPDNASIFSAEIKAIDLALDLINQSLHRKHIIFSDSLSVLQSLNNHSSDNPLIRDVLIKYNNVSTNKEVVFCWIPSHCGIHGNEKADRAAKAALTLDESAMKLPYTDFKPLIHSVIINTWQESWNREVDNKLHSIKPTIGEWHPGPQASRRDEVILSRLRIGHTYLTHSYILKRDVPPECVFCQEPYTIKHILLHCSDLILIRRQYYDATSLRELFETVHMDKIIDFLKAINVYFKI